MTLAAEKFASAPFPWFGGKRSVVDEVWSRLGRPTQYIEPFCGSAAMLLGAPAPASLEVIGDQNLYVANFWRCIKFQPEATAHWQDYPVSHVDLDARHRWLTDPARTTALRDALSDPEWPGDAQVAGWWVWGQCAWIGSGWCERASKIPHVSDAGRGVQSQIPHVGNAGAGSSPKSRTSDVASQIPFVSSAGMGVQGMGVQRWFEALARRLERVRIIHGDWSRCLNHHYGAADTAVFFDPPYRGFEALYSKDASKPLVADEVAAWCRENGAGLRIALCGHVGDYDLPGWSVFEWSRGRLTYGGAKTTDQEAIWFSPPCGAQKAQLGLFGGGHATTSATAPIHDLASPLVPASNGSSPRPVSEEEKGRTPSPVRRESGGLSPAVPPAPVSTTIGWPGRNEPDAVPGGECTAGPSVPDTADVPLGRVRFPLADRGLVRREPVEPRGKVSVETNGPGGPPVNVAAESAAGALLQIATADGGGLQPEEPAEASVRRQSGVYGGGTNRGPAGVPWDAATGTAESYGGDRSAAGGLSASSAKPALTDGEGSNDGPDHHDDRGSTDDAGGSRPNMGLHPLHGLPAPAVPAEPVRGGRMPVQRASGDQPRNRPGVRLYLQDVRPGADGRNAQDVHDESVGASEVAAAPQDIATLGRLLARGPRAEDFETREVTPCPSQSAPLAAGPAHNGKPAVPRRLKFFVVGKDGVETPVDIAEVARG